MRYSMGQGSIREILDRPLRGKLLKIGLLATVPLWMGMSAAFAAEEEGAKADIELEEIVTTGSRRKARSASDTPSPVDVISAEDFKNQGDGERWSHFVGQICGFVKLHYVV